VGALAVLSFGEEEVGHEGQRTGGSDDRLVFGRRWKDGLSGYLSEKGVVRVICI